MLRIKKFPQECDSGEGRLSACLWWLVRWRDGGGGYSDDVIRIRPVLTCQGAGFEPQPESLEPKEDRPGLAQPHNQPVTEEKGRGPCPVPAPLTATPPTSGASSSIMQSQWPLCSV